MEVKWIKLSVNIFSDEKILLIESLSDAYAILTVWFKLLCLAGRQNNSGVFTLNDRPYTGKMLATVFRMPEETVSSALAIFEEYGMIEIIDGVITIPGWYEYQDTERLEQIREQTKERVARFRQAQKGRSADAMAKDEQCNVTCNADVTLQKRYSNATVTLRNATERDKEEKESNTLSKEREKRERKPPTPEEVTAYVESRGNKIDARRFWEYFDAGGWKDANGAEVKNWKQKVITWENHEKQNKRSGMPAAESSIDFEQYDAQLRRAPQYRKKGVRA